MSSEAKRTPGVMRIEPDSLYRVETLFNGDNYFVARFKLANDAARAVHTWNCHDELVAALASTRSIAALHMKARGFSEKEIDASFPDTDAALAKARGQS